MHRKHVLAILSTIVASLMVSTTASFAWFDERDGFQNDNLTASSVSNYFADGNGSEEHPYRIDQPVHVYNLAWLQARGVFDPVKTYFKVADAGGNPVTIDFAGYLDGHTGTTGAIPPIGTEANPFKGVFDGNGSTFKNVWVSSNPDDWAEHPLDIGDTNTNKYVGFFGAIEQEGERKGDVKNFYLENIEVTSHVDKSFVGLIAGYSNSYTQNIGVKNGKLSFAYDLEQNYRSESSLVGKIGSDVYWEDMPSDSSGGELKIDPNSTDWPGGSFNTVSSNQYVAIPKSIEGTAYISGTMTKASHILKEVYKYSAKIRCDRNQTITLSSSNSVDATKNRTVCSAEFWKSYDNFKSGSTLIKPSVAPNGSSTKIVSLTGNRFVRIPDNCVWFAPQASGTCGISFAVDNMSSSRYISIYRYKRNADGSIPTSGWIETTMVFQKGGGSPLKNQNIVYYEVEISDEDVQNGYEYCIGLASSNANSSPANFFFLYLAGTNTTGGHVPGGAYLNKLDYVYKIGGQFLPSFSDSNYKPNHVMLYFDFLALEAAYACFNMDDIANSSTVYYYNTGLVLVDAIQYGSVGQNETTLNKFPPRLDTR